MQVGRKIYYDTTTGAIIWDKGEMEGSVRETTFEEDCEVMPQIADCGVLQLNFGEYFEQFMTMDFTIDVLTNSITFTERPVPERYTPIVDEKELLIQTLQQENEQLKAQLEALQA